MMSAKSYITSQAQKVEPDAPKSSWIAVLIGIIAALITLVAYFVLQRIFQNLPPERLLEAMQGTTNTLCFAGITASATIMPLMLTIFSFARRSETEFDSWFYTRIKNIGRLCVGAFFAGLFTLVVLSAQISDSQEISDNWYRVFYYLTVGGLTSMVAMLVMILWMLYYAIVHVLDVLNPLNQDEK